MNNSVSLLHKVPSIKYCTDRKEGYVTVHQWRTVLGKWWLKRSTRICALNAWYLTHVLLCTEGEQAALQEKQQFDVEIKKLQVYVQHCYNY